MYTYTHIYTHSSPEYIKNTYTPERRKSIFKMSKRFEYFTKEVIQMAEKAYEKMLPIIFHQGNTNAN